MWCFLSFASEGTLQMVRTEGDGRPNVKHEKPYDKSVFRSLTLITQFGINMLVPIALMTALGIFLDQKFETGWITIVLFFVGAIAGGQNVWRMAKKGLGDNERSKHAPGEAKKEE